ncbi:hypothetical protein PLESTF_000110300 [Pleodorina starrii]|nr:hypothetical protein PLESTF_000110300 [Pleodorina starrii]
MAHSTRTRPFSASSAQSHNLAANNSYGSYFMDRSGVLGLEGGDSKSDRPLPELLNLVLDAAHRSHQSRSALHPPTHAYALFRQRVASGPGSGTASATITAAGASTGPPSILHACRSLTNLPAQHSSLTVCPARGEAPKAGPRTPSPMVPAPTASGHAAAAAAAAASLGLRGPSPPPLSQLSASVSLPAAHYTSSTTSSTAQPDAKAAKGAATASRPTAAAAAAATTATTATMATTVKTEAAARAVAERLAAAERGTVPKSAPPKPTIPRRPTAPPKAPVVPPKPPTAAAHTAPRSSPPPHPGAATGSVGATGHQAPACGGAPAAAAAARATASPCRRSPAAAGGAQDRAAAAAAGGKGLADAGRARGAAAGGQTALQARHVGAAAEVAAAAEEARGLEGLGGSVVRRRVKSATADGGGSSGGAAAAAVAVSRADVGAAAAAAAAAESSRAVRQVARRPEVVVRALSAWEGAELEVVCLYDSNFQAANRQGQHGVPLRVPARAHIGPISYLYRWYCKRATQFRTPVAPADLPDAPAMPPTEEPWRRAGSGGGGGSGSATRGGRPASAGSVAAAAAAASGGNDRPGSAGGGVVAAMWLRKATSMRCHGGVSIGGDAASGGGGGAAGGGAIERPAVSSGRRLNCSLDPVMSLSEVVDLLEDLEIVPQLASRLDITKIFNAAAAAAAAASSSSSKTDPWVTRGGGGSSAASGLRARPSSAPRVLSKPAASVDAGGGSAGGGGGSAGGGNVIPRPQPHPVEVRFPVFKDILVRLAIAIACAQRKPPPPQAGGRGGGGGGGAATASSSSSSSYGWGHTMLAEEAVAAVRQLLEQLQLYRNDVRGLKHRLDQLARLAKEHAVRARANRMRYVAVPSPVEAAQHVAVAPNPGPPPPPPGARPGLLGRPLPPWGVLAAAPAPSYLTAVLTEEDQGDEARYVPAWREFDAVALDLGVLQPGELRRCRLLLHSRGPHTLSVGIDATDAPFCDLSHVGLHAVPPGMPLRVDVTVQLYDCGEVVGELRLRYSSSLDRREREVAVPVYGMVCPPGGGGGARTRPRSASERSTMAAKATREPVVQAVALAARATAPLGHCGPPRRCPSPSASPSLTTLSASSSYLAGYGSISAVEMPLAAQLSARDAAAAADAPPSLAAAAAAAAQKAAAGERWAEGRSTSGAGTDAAAGAEPAVRSGGNGKAAEGHPGGSGGGDGGGGGGTIGGLPGDVSCASAVSGDRPVGLCDFAVTDGSGGEGAISGSGASGCGGSGGSGGSGSGSGSGAVSPAAERSDGGGGSAAESSERRTTTADGGGASAAAAPLVHSVAADLAVSSAAGPDGAVEERGGEVPRTTSDAAPEGAEEEAAEAEAEAEKANPSFFITAADP